MPTSDEQPIRPAQAKESVDPMDMTPPGPRVSTSPGEPISPRTFRQVHAHKLIFDRIRREGIDITEDAGLVESVWRSRSHCTGSGWDDAARELCELLRTGDLDTLETMLTSPRDQSSRQMLTLSPFITHYSTPAITAETRRVTRGMVQYG